MDLFRQDKVYFQSLSGNSDKEFIGTGKNMKKENIQQMIRGWFIGPFTPAVFHSDQFEVAVKHYSAGDYEAAHYHNIATEITMIVSGRVRMSGEYFVGGDIVTVAPGEVTDFFAEEETTTLVVKSPAAREDKYFAEDKQ